MQIGLAAILGIAGVAALRLAWARDKRSTLMNGAGWLLLILSAFTGGMAAGAWGVSVASIFAMMAAMIVLAVAAYRSPPGKGSASVRRVKMLPEGGEPRQIGRRIGTFLIVVIAGLAASIAFGVSSRAIALLAGLNEADANATALFMVPMVWGILACVLLMQESRKSQFTSLAVCAAPLVPFLIAGGW